MPRKHFFLSLWILPALAATGQAQEPVSVGGPRQSAFESLRDSQWVRLASPGLGRRQGRVLERSPTELVLSPEPQPMRVGATSIDTLWTRGTSVKTGAIAGALIGGGPQRGTRARMVRGGE